MFSPSSATLTGVGGGRGNSYCVSAGAGAGGLSCVGVGRGCSSNRTGAIGVSFTSIVALRWAFCVDDDAPSIGAKGPSMIPAVSVREGSTYFSTVLYSPGVPRVERTSFLASSSSNLRGCRINVRSQ